MDMPLHHSIEGLLASVGKQIFDLRAKIDEEQQNMDRLKTEGLIYAGTWMKAGKYLYLIYPSDGFGQRKRQYVGCDPTDIQKAMDGIERGRKYDRSKERRKSLNNKLDRITEYLRSAERCANANW